MQCPITIFLPSEALSFQKPPALLHRSGKIAGHHRTPRVPPAIGAGLDSAPGRTAFLGFGGHSTAVLWGYEKVLAAFSGTHLEILVDYHFNQRQ